MFTILFLGDVVGRPGRKVLTEHLGQLRAEHKPDLVIVNGENSAGGLGIDPTTSKEIFAAGADLITTGNHIWNRKEFIPVLEKQSDRILRPINFAPGAPGTGALRWRSPSGVEVGVINAMGRIFMTELLDCPFRSVEQALENELAGCQILFLDFHGEATSEKVAMAHFLDGRVTAVVGTHTHVQTADERIFPKGLAYISDVGMCGPSDGIIGVEAAPVVEKFLSGRPMRFEVSNGAPMINGVVIACDETTGKASSIARINLTYR